MKNNRLLLLVCLLIAGLVFSKDMLAQKTPKSVKKEIKKLKKDGWKTFPGHFTMEEQIMKVRKMKNELGEDGTKSHMYADGSSVAQTMSAADMQSTEIAKIRMIGQVESNLRSVLENNLSNIQVNSKDAISLQQTIELSVNRVAKKLGRVDPVLKIYREVGNNTEVRVMLAYNWKKVQEEMVLESQVLLNMEVEKVRERNKEHLYPAK